jgi:hypothetical protein
LRLEVHNANTFVSFFIVTSPHVVHELNSFFTEALSKHGFTFNTHGSEVITREKLNWFEASALKRSEVSPFFRCTVELFTLLDKLNCSRAITSFAFVLEIALTFAVLHVLNLVRDEPNGVGRLFVTGSTLNLEMPLSRSRQSEVLEIFEGCFDLES